MTSVANSMVFAVSTHHVQARCSLLNMKSAHQQRMRCPFLNGDFRVFMKVWLVSMAIFQMPFSGEIQRLGGWNAARCAARRPPTTSFWRSEAQVCIWGDGGGCFVFKFGSFEYGDSLFF